MTRTIRDEDNDGAETCTVRAKALRSFVSKKGNECLVCLVDGEEAVVPQSAIHDNSEVYEPGNEGDLVVLMWLARARGWA